MGRVKQGICGLMCWLLAIWAPSLSHAKGGKLADVDQDFACRLLAEAAKRHTDGNILVSPCSAKLALTMAYVGASGQTREEMAAVLGMPEREEGESSAGADAREWLDSVARMKDDVTLEAAHSMWVKEGFAVKPEFTRWVEQAFDAAVHVRPFDSTLPAALNDWVKQRTHGRVETILERCHPDARLYLVNALYFKGQWTTAFDPKETADDAFALAGGAVVNVPMMRRSIDCDVLDEESFSAVKLPFGRAEECGTGPAVSLMVFLPHGGMTPEQWLAGLSAESWSRWMRDWHAESGAYVGLPRFAIEFHDDLKDTLIAMGMPSAFNAASDFSGMSDAPLYIGSVLHRTVLSVDEKGAEAAGATVVEMLERGEPFSLYANRPFVLALVDEASGGILFMGIVRNPSVRK